MTDKFDELEKEIMYEMRKVYTETVIDHAMNPRNVGRIAHADGFSRITGPCGDTMKIWLRINGGTIVDASFSTDGCSASVACGSMATEMIKNKDVTQALAISQNDVLKTLGGLPEGNLHCALLAANTVKAAIQDYITMRKEPWKKAYRK
jgi:nitrogen fixation NifU-like protein